MIILTLRPLRILLLAALGAGFALVSQAQVSPLLSPLLTQDPQTAPITTLSIDLLTPQRTYVFDATGASVLANDLDPSIYASTLSSAAAETDTAVRDSSQAGHVSPFASGTTRLGLSFSGGEGSVTEGTLSPLATVTNPEPGTEMDAGYRSSWGTSSSFGSQPAASSWGTKALPVERLGRTQSRPSETGTSLNTQDVAKTNTEDVTKTNTIDSRIRRIGATRLNQPGTPTTTDRARRSVSARNSSGTALTNSAMPPSKEPLLFAPASSQGYSFGNSPFSAPGGEGELTFLHPDILSGTTLSSSYSSNHDRNMTQGSLRQGLDESGTLATSATHYGLAPRSSYGLAPRSKTSRSLTGTTSKANARKTHSLSNGMLDSESPQ